MPNAVIAVFGSFGCRIPEVPIGFCFKVIQSRGRVKQGFAVRPAWDAAQMA